MRKRGGFTLVELMVVIAIIGILAVTAVQAYKTWLTRTLGSEAKAMMKSLVDGQIVFYLEHNTFFPTTNETYEIYGRGGTVPASIDGKPLRQKIKEELNVFIPVGHSLDYFMLVDRTPGAEKAVITIQAEFPLFKDANYLMGEVFRDGRVRLTAE